MRNTLSLALLSAVTLSISACTYIPSQTNLGAVASNSGMSNVTTGDGTFENYTATGYHTGTEVGIAVGIPFIWKFKELYPVQSNEVQMTLVANSAKALGADAMINVTPPQETYWGIPFFFVGLYIDRAAGTGIDIK